MPHGCSRRKSKKLPEKTNHRDTERGNTEKDKRQNHESTKERKTRNKTEESYSKGHTAPGKTIAVFFVLFVLSCFRDSVFCLPLCLFSLCPLCLCDSFVSQRPAVLFLGHAAQDLALPVDLVDRPA